MKKTLLLQPCVQQPAFGQFTEGFEDYVAGDYVCVVSDHFDIWTAGTEGSEW